MGNCSANVSHGWATHGADVAFVEGKFGGKRVSGVPGSRNQSCTVQKGCELTPMELALVDRMQSFWGSFIRSGRPVGGEDNQEWPVFNNRTQAVMQFDVGQRGGVRNFWKKKECAFWDKEAPFGPH
eukprot:COSAG01_NODE_2472_length_7625_cov_9.664895_5_plen_126_part_00